MGFVATNDFKKRAFDKGVGEKRKDICCNASYKEKLYAVNVCIQIILENCVDKENYWRMEEVEAEPHQPDSSEWREGYQFPEQGVAGENYKKNECRDRNSDQTRVVLYADVSYALYGMGVE